MRLMESHKLLLGGPFQHSMHAALLLEHVTKPSVCSLHRMSNKGLIQFTNSSERGLCMQCFMVFIDAAERDATAMHGETIFSGWSVHCVNL